MADELYKLKPLNWQIAKHPSDAGERWAAATTFGPFTFVVESPEYNDTNEARWRYCFDEYYDEDSGTAATSDEAKAKCEQIWRDRIVPMLEPVPFQPCD